MFATPHHHQQHSCKLAKRAEMGKLCFGAVNIKPHILIEKLSLCRFIFQKSKQFHIFANKIFSDSGTSQRQLGDDDGAIRHRTFSPPLFTFELNSALCLHRNFHFLILIAVVATSQWNIGGNEPIRTICKCCSILPNGSTVYKNHIFILFNEPICCEANASKYI